MKHVEFAMQVLTQNHPFDDEMLAKFMNETERRGCKSLRYYITNALGDYAQEKSSGVIEERLLIGIIDGMNSYIRDYRSIPAFKQKIWNTFRDWIVCVAERYDVSDAEELLEDIMEKPVEDDTAVAVVKYLHALESKDGMTKHEMADKMGVNIKTVQNSLHLLDPLLDNEDGTKKKNAQKKRNSPRFGGQLMQVKIVRDKEQKHYCPDTMSPVAMQLSVYQVGTLLKSLQLAYDTEVSYNSMNMAINVWSQLTEYCRDRVKTKVRPKDEEFHSFLKMIEDMESGEPFVTEKEIFDDELIENKLNLAFKGSRRCSVKYKDKILRNCTIYYDCKNYYIRHEGKEYIAKPDEIEDVLLFEE